MKKYQIQNSIGNGNFSTVFKAQLLPERVPCAIKIIKSYNKVAQRQAQFLRKIKHPNVITLIDFQQDDNQSKLILQYVGINALELYLAYSQGLKQQQVKCILFQAVLGLSCVHSYGIIHRDIKPENIMIDKKRSIVKLIDFGLAIHQAQVSTDYIATRWYRAPQNLLGTKQYTCAIDIFSLGCVIVELYLGSPLFPGSNNIDQLYKMFDVLGYPEEGSWMKGYRSMSQLGMKINKGERKIKINLKQILQNCDAGFIDIIERMLCINPKNRITCNQILKHEYFKDIKNIIPTDIYRRFEQDILQKKPLFFKGFMSGTTGRTNTTRKQAQNNVLFNSNTIKAQTNKNRQKPFFLRQKKSTSLDSYRFRNRFGYKIEKNIQGKKSKIMITVAKNNIDNHCRLLSRKYSTPLLASYVPFSPEMLQKSKISQKQPISTNKKTKNKKWPKQSIETIMEELDRENKCPQLGNQLIKSSHEQVSKRMVPHFLQLTSKCNASKTFTQKQNGQKTVYPVIPNVKLVQQPSHIEKNGYKFSRMTSPSVYLSYNDQSFKSLVPLNQQTSCTNMNVFLRAQPINKIFMKTQSDLSTISKTSNIVSNKMYRSFESCQMNLENSINRQINIYQLKNQQMMNYTIKSISPRQNIIYQNYNILLKPQIVMMKPSNKIKRISQIVKDNNIPNSNIFGSANRVKANCSPQNNFIQRQHKIITINSLVKPFTYLSPPHVKI